MIDQNRDTILREAEGWAIHFRRRGYPDAEVMPQYCINDIGPDRIYTRTVCVHVGDRKEAAALSTYPAWFRRFVTWLTA